MKDTMITREEAQETLFQLADSGVLNDDLENKLNEIANLIEREEHGFHFWGAPFEDYTKTVTAYRTDLVSDKMIEDFQRIEETYKFTPCEAERDNIDE